MSKNPFLSLHKYRINAIIKFKFKGEVKGEVKGNRFLKKAWQKLFMKSINRCYNYKNISIFTVLGKKSVKQKNFLKKFGKNFHKKYK